MLESIVNRFYKFIKNEEGAVTVDWVVLTAAIAMLGVFLQISMGTATKNAADTISAGITSVDMMTF